MRYYVIVIEIAIKKKLWNGKCCKNGLSNLPLFKLIVYLVLLFSFCFIVRSFICGFTTLVTNESVVIWMFKNIFLKLACIRLSS
ncbi:Uncharacterized protein APZ42_026268 [Daphnia magna]|uniref:Uncharacterized protein n=1 Tax=Daphnia magna TaxID=35525 RepID=A0A164SB22_9CRUS|nr:Uncharacterized protein APZ42_026268 [Daphnia magna]